MEVVRFTKVMIAVKLAEQFVDSIKLPVFFLSCDSADRNLTSADREAKVMSAFVTHFFSKNHLCAILFGGLKYTTSIPKLKAFFLKSQTFRTIYQEI